MEEELKRMHTKGNPIDYTGQRFGKLTVVRYIPGGIGEKGKWECKCDCGNVIEVRAARLRAGKLKGCGTCENEGCTRLNITGSPIDYTGQRFGKLVALNYIQGNVKKGIPAKWHCQCDCGNFVDVPALKLRNGSVTMCDVCAPFKARNKGSINYIVGRTFGNLTVLKQYDEGKRHICYCRCKCGTEKELLYYNVINGLTKSCGVGKCALRGPRTDLTGLNKGKLVVLNYDFSVNKWNCRCSCGDICQKTTHQLSHGSDKMYCDNKEKHPELKAIPVKTKSDLVGEVFGKLTVLYRAEDRTYSNRKHTVWHCKCECGNELDVLGWNLKSGEVTTCTSCKRIINRALKASQEKTKKPQLQPFKKHQACRLTGTEVTAAVLKILNLPRDTEEDLKVIKIKLDTLKELKILSESDVVYYLYLLEKENQKEIQ